MNAVAKVGALHSRAVEKRSSVSRSFAAVVLIVLIFGFLVTAFLPGHSLRLPPFTARGASLERELDEAIGATVEPLDPVTARSLGLEPRTGGLVVTSVASGGPAARTGVHTGDVIVGIDRPVRSMKDLALSLRRSRNALTLTLMRNGRSVIVPLKAGSPAGQAALFKEEEEWR
jgi:membrane-associated protease RseP (regulator of RpoE activity)